MFCSAPTVSIKLRIKQYILKNWTSPSVNSFSYISLIIFIKVMKSPHQCPCTFSSFCYIFTRNFMTKFFRIFSLNNNNPRQQFSVSVQQHNPIPRPLFSSLDIDTSFLSIIKVSNSNSLTPSKRVNNRKEVFLYNTVSILWKSKFKFTNIKTYQNRTK